MSKNHRAARHQPGASTSDTDIPHEMWQHFHRCKDLERNYRLISEVFTLQYRSSSCSAWMGRVWRQELGLGSRLCQIRGITYDHLVFSDYNASQGINHKTAKRDFCCPEKRSPLAVKNQLDNDIENAKRNWDRAKKKQLERKHVGTNIPRANANVFEGKS